MYILVKKKKKTLADSLKINKIYKLLGRLIKKKER